MIETHVVAKVLLKNQEGKVLILRRSETDERRPLKGDIPGGWVDPGEDIIAAAIRETEEEAGVKLNFDDLTLIYTHTELFYTDKKNVSWIFFIADTNETEIKLSPEHDRAEWLTLDDAIKNISQEVHKVQNDFLVYVRDNNLL